MQAYLGPKVGRPTLPSLLSCPRLRSIRSERRQRALELVAIGDTLSCDITGTTRLMDEKIAVVGLGYVGLPVALAFARHFPGTVGFDIDAAQGRRAAAGPRPDRGAWTTTSCAPRRSDSRSDPADLRGATFFVVAVPTPVDEDNRPDLTPVMRASETVGSGAHAGRGGGLRIDGLSGRDRGDLRSRPGARVRARARAWTSRSATRPSASTPATREHTLERITKVVSGAGRRDPRSRRRRLRRRSSRPGVHRAPSIKVAEAAKVIENTQRDLNIALMNEIALICDRTGHPDRRRARGGRHQVELPALHARAWWAATASASTRTT